jgi:steroid delta-isomerase-like uncharacterized protein
MSADNRATTGRFFEQVCNGRRLDVTEELFAKNHVYRDPANAWVGAGPDGMKQLIGAYHRAFPDASWSVEETLVDGNTVISRWIGKGTHKGDLSGIAPTGKPVHVTGVWIHRFTDGKISESWNHWDSLGLLQQIGAVPGLGQSAKPAAS